MSEVRKLLAAYVKTDDERNMLTDEELKARILENLNKTNQKRLQEVIYIVKVYDKDKNQIAIDTFLLKEADLLFGTK
ncbi:hypothetical protein [Chryseobacterium mucoviscidosis]|uniref:hypothetical protein n=1 Tax=Chryseobacterium mucoviscidosis TaxID=1945581 RepID=UPI0031D90011